MKHNPQYGYLAPFYGQAKRVAWDYLKEYTRMLPGYKANESELTVRIYRPQFNDNVKFFLAGADNPDSHRGIYLDGGVLDEYGDMDPQVWDKVIQPALSDRLGWAIFIGTPKGRNHFYEVLNIADDLMSGSDPEWYSGVYKASQTGIINPAELARLKKTMSEDAYMQEYECSFTAALVGAYYGKILNKMGDMITKVPWDPSAPVRTYWDLGINDTNAIWFIQRVAREWHAINYLEDSGQDLPFYASQLRRMQDNFGYDYSRHLLPHDANQRSIETGKTRYQSLKNTELEGHIEVLPRQGVQDGIEASRIILPTVYFDEERCARGIDCLRNYEKEWDAKNRVFSSTPRHNWASNGADAFRYFAMHARPDVDHSKLPRQCESGYNIFTNEKLRGQSGRYT